jgi:formate dehydrogenase
MTVTSRRTFCRICEAFCGLVVDIEEPGEDELSRGQIIVAVKADPQHPVSKGFACIKGTSFAAIHHDVERLNYPMKRVNGVFERISWNQAIAEISAKVRSLKKNHGANSLAHYMGNPSFSNYKNILLTEDFIKCLGSKNLFASHSIDLNNKFQVSADMYGVAMVHPIPDLEHTDFFLCLGSNPVVSQMSVLSVINPLAKLRAIEARGGKVVIVDPRRSETAAKVGEHFFIRPGTDALLLLAMLHVLHYELDFCHPEADSFASGAAQMLAAAEDWPPEQVAELTGISAADIRRLCDDYFRARGAAIYMSTGVNMGPFGSIAYWLVQGINYLSGNLDRQGGLLVPEGAIHWLQLARRLVAGDPDARTSVHGWPQLAGCFPVAALPEEILQQAPDRIRALFISAGNPLHSTPHPDWQRALQQLELVVCVDIYKNETAAVAADYLLPATDMLERSDFPLSHMPLQTEPLAQYTGPVLQPKFERREEWRIFTDILMASGAPRLPDKPLAILARVNQLLECTPGKRQLDPDQLLAWLLKLGGKVSLKQLIDQPQGVRLPNNRAGTFLGARQKQAINLAPERIINDLPRLAQYAANVSGQGAAAANREFYLIGRRSRKSHNSWMHHNKDIRQAPSNQVYLHPADADSLAIGEGERVRISCNGRSISLPVAITNDIMPGVIAVPHGWGQQQSGAGQNGPKGENINWIIPGGYEYMEPPSGQAIMLGHRVSIDKLPRLEP